MAKKKSVRYMCTECGFTSDSPSTHHGLAMEAQGPVDEEPPVYRCSVCGYSGNEQIKHCGKMMKLIKAPK